MTAGASPAAWHADPYGRHELRYWDGVRWTEHVSDSGRQSLDYPDAERQGVPTVARSTARITRDVARAGVAAVGDGGGSVFTEPVLVVNQKAKLMELTAQFAVFDRNGTQIGGVRQVGQSAGRKVLRALTSLDQFLTHRLEIVDMSGAVLLRLVRPAKVMKSRILVQDPHGNEVGQIVQQNVIGKIRFSLEAGGAAVGSLNAENWRAWNFSIRDAEGAEVARITKTWEGLAKTMFTTADNYVVEIMRRLEDPLRALVVASALSVDTALKQDARGLG